MIADDQHDPVGILLQPLIEGGRGTTGRVRQVADDDGAVRASLCQTAGRSAPGPARHPRPEPPRHATETSRPCQSARPPETSAECSGRWTAWSASSSMMIPRCLMIMVPFRPHFRAKRASVQAASPHPHPGSAPGADPPTAERPSASDVRTPADGPDAPPAHPSRPSNG